MGYYGCADPRSRQSRTAVGASSPPVRAFGFYTITSQSWKAIESSRKHARISKSPEADAGGKERAKPYGTVPSNFIG